MANEVKITVSAKDEASADLKKIAGVVDKLSLATKTGTDFLRGMGVSLSDFASPAELAGKAVGALVDQVKEGIQFNIDYAKQVEDTARKLGITAEESSKLIQVTDDLRIDYGALEMAMRTALDKGITPSIANLEKMGDEYKALKTPIEKAQYAIDKFGSRAGLEMQKALELSTGELTKMGQAVETSGLLMSEDGVQAAKDYALAVDGLEDSWAGLRNRLVQEAIPALTGVTNAIAEAITFQDLLGEAQKRGIDLEMKSVGQAMAYTDTVETLTEKIVAYDKALKDSQAAQEDFRLSEHDTKTLITDTALEVSNLSFEYDYNTGIVEGLGMATQIAADQVERVYGSAYTATDIMKNYTAELLYNKVAANLDADSALSLAQQMGLVDEKTKFALTRLQELTKEFDLNHDGVVTADEDLKLYLNTIAGLNNEVLALPDGKTITIDVRVTGDKLPSFTNGTGVTVEARASGGPMYPGNRYTVGEAGYPETVVQGANGGYVYPTAPVNNYNLTINSQARSEQVAASFALMQAMAR